jgi:hypothetical protein
MDVSKFEQLPDEILLEICIYLRPFDVINSFGQLNNRLERTISQYRHDADLHHLTLKQFQQWYDHLRLYTAESIVNLVISNWNSPGQIYLFNQLTKNFSSLCELFPNIKQLRLIDFTHNDIEIISKLERLERIFIDADALIPLSCTIHTLFDQYLFCSSNQFQEIRLWGIEGGIRLQHHVKILENTSLERLTISVASMDDLILLFQRSPNLTNFNIEVTQYTFDGLRQKLTMNILLKYLKIFHFQTTDLHVLPYEDLAKLVSNIPMIEFLSLDMDTNDVNYADGHHWNGILASLSNLKHVFFKIRIWLNPNALYLDVDTILQSFQSTNIPICCYADSKTLHIDTIPYDMTKFDTNMSVTVSPSAKLAKATNMELLERQSRRVQTLVIDGQHERTSINDYLFVINRFSGIEILQINAISIEEEEDNNFEINHKNFRLPHLGYLHYIRSTSCKVHLPFFMFLVDNPVITPRLKALSIMYGDLIYLCKRLDGCILERIKELWLYAGDADGHVILKDVNLLLKTFPCLYHFFFNNQSSRLINRHLQSIIEMILCSSPKLISFRISCNVGSLNLFASMDNEAWHSWIKRICALDQHESIHVTINKKMLAIWK